MNVERVRRHVCADEVSDLYIVAFVGAQERRIWVRRFSAGLRRRILESGSWRDSRTVRLRVDGRTARRLTVQSRIAARHGSEYINQIPLIHCAGANSVRQRLVLVVQRERTL